MSNKNKHKHKQHKNKKHKTDSEQTAEEVLKFEDAKDMTVEEATKKQEELEAGITPEDNLLDRYIKQHREEIEADKFETKQLRGLSQEINRELAKREARKEQRVKAIQVVEQEPRFEAETSIESAMKTDTEEKPDLQETRTVDREVPAALTAEEEKSQDTVEIASLQEKADSSVFSATVENIEEDSLSEVATEESPVKSAKTRAQEARAQQTEKVLPVTPPIDFDDFDDTDDDATPFYKSKKLWLSLLGFLAFMIIVWAVYANYTAMVKSGAEPSSSRSASSSKKSSSSKSSSTGKTSKALREFEALYDSFFTDEKQTALKNDRFAQLPALETALKALEGTDDYKTAKTKFDKLKAAIEATKAINDQFDKPAVVDGKVDDTATAKPDASFTAPSTGLSKVDAGLTAAVNFGRSQLSGKKSGSAESAPAGGNAAAPAPAAPTPSQPAKNATLSNGIVLNYANRIVYGNDNGNLQRDRSRVPYDDQTIADAYNPAWEFAPGVLEKIIATSNQRGYFSGNEFILEKVNIVKGNGYYNLFKTDGTYLFSINAKTGYFVGNASGNSDGLDF